MAAGTLVSRVLGLVRTSLLASVVGLSLSADAFAVANTLPNYVYILLSAGVLNAILIPQITKAMKRPDGGQDFVDRLLTASLALIAVVTLAATLAAPWLVSATSDLAGSAHQLAVFFAYICLPQIMFYGLYAVLGQVLNSRGEFASYMWSPVLANVVQIAGLVTFLVMWSKQVDPATWTPAMVWVLAGSSTAGIALQGLVLLIPLRRTGFRWTPRWGLRGQGFGAVSRIVVWSFTALVIAQFGGLFAQWVMTHVRARPGNLAVASIAAQANAFLVFMLPHSFITTSILTALYPRMSRIWHDRDVPGMRGVLRQGLAMPAVGIIPASLAMMVLARPVMGVLFPGFNAREVRDASEILAVMAIGTMAFGVTTLQQRYCFAREDGRTNLWLQILLTVVQVGFAVGALYVPGRWAVVTIASGQTVANIVAGTVFVLVARRQLDGIGLASVVRLYVRLALASVVAAAAAAGLVWWAGRFGDAWLTHVAVLAAAGVLFGAVFLVGARVLHLREVDDLLAPVVRRLRRG